MKTNVNQQIH